MPDEASQLDLEDGGGGAAAVEAEDDGTEVGVGVLRLWLDLLRDGGGHGEELDVGVGEEI